LEYTVESDDSYIHGLPESVKASIEAGLITLEDEEE
jgi:hypothetical protein